MSGVELREGVSGVELREAGGKIHLSVYPSVVESPYDMGMYEEVVRSGAFRRSLGQNPDVVLNLEHRGLALASTRAVAGAPTLALSEPARGLRGDAELSPEDPDARLLMVKSTQAPLEASFAFKVTRQKWDENYEKREILEVDLHRGDISIVGRAASPATQGTVDIGLRSRGELEQRRRNAEMIGQRMFTAVGHPGEVITETLGSGLHVASTVPVAPSYTSLARAKRDRAMTAGSIKRRGDKYTQTEVDELGREGKAHKAADGHYHFPIKDHEDVKNAVKALGRIPAAERPSVRRFVMKRARELKATYAIPATWKADGTLA